MVTHEAWLTKLCNEYLAGFGNWLLALFGQKAANPAEPWPDYMVMQIVVGLILVALFLLLRGSLSVTKPGPMQQVFELIHGFVSGQAEEHLGHDTPRHIVLFETL